MKNTLQKSIFSLILIILLGFSVGCSSTTQLSNSENVCSFGDCLRKIEGVSSVFEIQQENPVFKEKYIVTFTQPIDWNDFSKGTFEQRVEIGFQGYENICVYYINGYCLLDYLYGSDSIFKVDDRDELSTEFNGNYINIEYRFYGDSVPYGLSNDNVYLWEYLTEENAARDFYSISEKLSSVLNGKKVITGHSKGGYCVNAVSYYYPDSYDAFVSFVAPLCYGPEDPRVLTSVYNILNTSEQYGVLLDFAVLCLENRDELENIFYQMAIDDNFRFRDAMTKEILWDLSVLDFLVSYIQYEGDMNILHEILQMPDFITSEHKLKMDLVLQTVNEWVLADSWNVDSFLFPYSWQACVEMGQYGYNVSLFRDKIVEVTGEDLLVLKEDMGIETYKSLLFTEEQQKVLVYNDFMYKALLNWSQSTKSNVIMIFGELDPWYAVSIPKTDNECIHTYCVDGKGHNVSISDLNEDDYSNCTVLLNKWLLSK